MIILLMGVSGSGKTAVGSVLARRHGIPFVDGDDLHPRDNIQKMSSGVPLTDEDRAPWLETIRSIIEEHAAAGTRLIIACSALKESYRRQLTDGVESLELVFLTGSREILGDRLAHRTGHFFDPALLDSQLDALEEPRDALVVNIAADLDAIVETIETMLDLRQKPEQSRG